MLLTKSRYVRGLSCPRELWLEAHDPEALPAPDVSVEYVIEQGVLAGELARALFPGGVLVSEGADPLVNAQSTQELLSEGVALFEAGALADDLYARADVLVPAGDGWVLVEVKSSTRVKDEHLHDLSFQKHVFEKAGFLIRGCVLCHVNKGYVRSGSLDVNALFTQEDAYDRVVAISEGIEDRIAGLRRVLAAPKAPAVGVANGCSNGVKCACDACWDFLPDNHVFSIVRGGKKSLELYEEGYERLEDVPLDRLNERQSIQQRAVTSGEPHVDHEKIKDFLGLLSYPRYYLDFEAFQTAIPLYDGLWPFAQVPFQYSVHIDDGDRVSHEEFLHDSQTDPRKPFLDSLKRSLGSEGPIIVYYKGFEVSRLKELAKAYPEEQAWVDSIINRIVDLFIPFSNFWYYHPSQQGKCSLKRVLPALTGEGYDGFRVDNGMLAAAYYHKMTFSTIEDEDAVRQSLLEYCARDTEGMIWIVDSLERATKD